MNKIENVELTMVCLIEQKGYYLLQERKKEDWKGWALPGGHIEPGESIVEATKREILEETGLTLDLLALSGIKQFSIPNGRYLVFLFKSELFHGNLKDSDEGRVKWIHKDYISELDTVKDLKILIDTINSPEMNELQYIGEKGNRKLIIL